MPLSLVVKLLLEDYSSTTLLLLLRVTMMIGFLTFLHGSILIPPCNIRLRCSSVSHRYTRKSYKKVSLYKTGYENSKKTWLLLKGEMAIEFENTKEWCRLKLCKCEHLWKYTSVQTQVLDKSF